MKQPAVIIEWYGPYDTLDDARRDNEGMHEHALCIALGAEGDARYIISWHEAGRRAESFPVDDRLSDSGNQSFYVGWIVSNYPGATRRTAEWMLIRALRPELNEPPAPCPPGSDKQYCGSVCSWFYDTDAGRKIDPPAGFPTVLTFNSPEYDDPSDPEQVVRLRLGPAGAHGLGFPENEDKQR